MPTHQVISGDTWTDLGWGEAEIERDPETGRRRAVVITCKACKARVRYDTTSGGGIVNGFQHIEPCPVLEEVKRAANAGLDRAHAAARRDR